MSVCAPNEKRELISDVWGKRGATYGEKGVCRRINKNGKFASPPSLALRWSSPTMLSRPPSIERRVCAPSSELMSMRVASSAPSSTSTSSQLSLCFAEISQMKKKEFQGEIWEEWALTYGRNGVE